MQNIQPVIHHGTLVAIIVARRAVIDDTLSDKTFRHTQAMCLYALELAEDGQPECYTDADADAYAKAALGPR